MLCTVQNNAMASTVSQYRGRLDADEIAEGINAANRNARRLYEDAKILFDTKRYPSSAALAILSIEESGKIPILRRLAVATDGDEVDECWRAYRWHTEKNVSWILPDLLAAGARRLDDFRPLFDDDSDHPELLDQVKQLALYSDCLNEGHWSEPADVVDDEFADSLVKIAGVFIKDEEVGEREIELWIEHLSPVWRTTDKQMKQGLERWYDEMQKEGLAPEGVNEMRQFVREGIDIKE